MRGPHTSFLFDKMASKGMGSACLEGSILKRQIHEKLIQPLALGNKRLTRIRWYVGSQHDSALPKSSSAASPSHKNWPLHHTCLALRWLIDAGSFPFATQYHTSGTLLVVVRSRRPPLKATQS